MGSPYSLPLLALSVALLSLGLAGAAAAPVQIVGVEQPSAMPANVDGTWAGASAYHLWCFNQTVRQDTLRVMQQHQLRVLRIFVSHCDDVGDVEAPVGVWNDTILHRIDQLMYEAHAFGVKVTIALHDRWMLGCNARDAYVAKYSIPVLPHCSQYDPLRFGNDATVFYQSPSARSDFKNRLTHILTHQNPHLANKTWAQLSDVLFSVEPENEPQSIVSELAADWQCDMTSHLRALLDAAAMRAPMSVVSGAPASTASAASSRGVVRSPVLVTTGGSFVEVFDPLLTAACPGVDVLTIHAYQGSLALAVRIAEYSVAARKHGKRFIVQETGATAATAAAKAAALRSIYGTTLAEGNVPTMVWSLSKTSHAAPDFGIWPGDAAFDVVAGAAALAAAADSEQRWPELP